MSPLADPVVMVGGSPRSGTTLLRNMLTSHPQLAVPNESRFIASVYRVLLEQGRTGDMPLAWSLVRDHASFQFWQLDRAALREVVASEAPASYADLVRALYAAYAMSHGKPRAADKTPANAYRFPLLASMFPGSGFVHLVRDPREVSMSLSLQPWQVGGIGRAARLWRTWVRAAHAAGRQLDGSFIEVRYEDVVAQPERELRRVCELGKIDFDPAMLDYTAERTLKSGSQFSRSRERIQRNARRWQDEMSLDDIAVVELVAGDLMDRLGYERVVDRPRPRALARRLAEDTDRVLRSRVRKRWFPPGPPLPTRYEPPTGPIRPLQPADV